MELKLSFCNMEESIEYNKLMDFKRILNTRFRNSENFNFLAYVDEKLFIIDGCESIDYYSIIIYANTIVGKHKETKFAIDLALYNQILRTETYSAMKKLGDDYADEIEGKILKALDIQ